MKHCVFTIFEVARMLKVAPRTVSKWFDSGRLHGYRIPGSQSRRIPREYVERFLREHGTPELMHEWEQSNDKTEEATT